MLRIFLSYIYSSLLKKSLFVCLFLKRSPFTPLYKNILCNLQFFTRSPMSSWIIIRDDGINFSTYKFPGRPFLLGGHQISQIIYHELIKFLCKHFNNFLNFIQTRRFVLKLSCILSTFRRISIIYHI